MDLKDKKIVLGTITSSYGLRGYFKVLSFTEQPEQLINYSPLLISEEKIIKLKIKYVKKNILICSSSNINSKNDVDTILKENIYTYRSNLPKINELYHVDLIGMKVKNFDKVIGKVVALYNFGAGEILEVKNSINKNTSMFPFYKPFLINIDKKENTINFKITEN